MKSWLKFGLTVGVIFGLLALINIFLVNSIGNESSAIGKILVNFDGLNFLMALIVLAPLLIFGFIKFDEYSGFNNETNFLLFAILINILFYFIIGFIIGAIVGLIIEKRNS